VSTELLIRFVEILGLFLYIALIARVVLSWIQLDPSNPIVTVVYQVTEPILAPIRRVLPRTGMLDLSPMIAIILVTIIREVLRAILINV
jgi:YggT family protein